MPQYNLSAPEESIVTSWLFEVAGYLDAAVNVGGVSAREALNFTPLLDVTNWIRVNTKAPATGQSDWEECGMVWWIRANEQINITPPTRPPETAAWIARLQEWDLSIQQGFTRSSQAERNTTTVPITAEDGMISTMPAGNHLASQQSLISKVLGVLQ